MRIVHGILAGIFTLALLGFYDVACELVIDHMEALPSPIIFQFAEAFSPVWFSYMLLPLMVGFSAWKSKSWGSVTFLFIGIGILTVLLIGFGRMLYLNDIREVTIYRYLGNVAICALTALSLYFELKVNSKTTTKPN